VTLQLANGGHTASRFSLISRPSTLRCRILIIARSVVAAMAMSSPSGGRRAPCPVRQNLSRRRQSVSAQLSRPASWVPVPRPGPPAGSQRDRPGMPAHGKSGPRGSSCRARPRARAHRCLYRHRLRQVHRGSLGEPVPTVILPQPGGVQPGQRAGGPVARRKPLSQRTGSLARSNTGRRVPGGSPATKLTTWRPRLQSRAPLPEWIKVEPCPSEHLATTVAATRAMRGRAEAALDDLEGDDRRGSGDPGRGPLQTLRGP
jgi:hypothetical protein